jgi:hypothetical protein
MRAGIADWSAVISTIHRGATVQYRVVGTVRPSVARGETTQAEPGLEESHVWLMRAHRVADVATAP